MRKKRATVKHAGARRSVTRTRQSHPPPLLIFCTNCGRPEHEHVLVRQLAFSIITKTNLEAAPAIFLCKTAVFTPSPLQPAQP